MNLNTLTRELIDIPSLTGDEAAVASFLVQYLKRLDYRVELQPVVDGRSNLIATTAGTPSVFLSTHMDTVPTYVPSSEDDKYIYGRGACDAKGIIAGQIVAAETLRAEGTEIGLLFTVDEEAGSLGAKAANDHPLARSCEYLINGEPTDNILATGSKGSLRLRIKTEGRAGHSAYPERGRSAIDILLDVLGDLRNWDWPSSEKFGETTCNIGTINGGTRPNVIAAEAEAELQIRLVTAGTQIKERLELLVAGRAKVEYLSMAEPVDLLAVEGFETAAVRFTTDVPYLTNWGTPLLIGPGSIMDAHTDHERVSKRELTAAVDIYAGLVRTLIARSEQ
ncbi:MAG: M20/M25/M40 family metallo-hydrolase [Pyrinomonadaceae bacterium]